MQIVKCFRYRLSPTTEQEQQFLQFSGCRRHVWNWALHRKKAHYLEHKQNLTYNVLAGELVLLKKEREFLKECHSQILQQSLMDLDSAFKAFFEKRAKYPKPKKKHVCPNAFRIPQNVFVVGGRVSIPKIGKVKAVIHRPLEGLVKSATVKQDSDGNWYITFVCHAELADKVPTFDNPVGIDVGLESFITLDNGEKVEPPKFFRKGQKKLKKLQQAVSRCPKGSQNRKKAKAKVARQHCKTRNKRNDFLHKLSKSLMERYDTFCIEDLNLKGLVKTKLAKSLSDASLGKFLRMLEYKAQWEGKTVIKVGRFFASSKTCHTCGHKQSLELSDRKWVCDGCGTFHDRDINASQNILSEGLRLVASGIGDTQNAFGGDVRLVTTSCRQ
jgi:putative transposase